MQVNWPILKFALLMGGVLAIYGFANHRGAAKKINSHTIEFLGGNDLYLTEDAVNKLLIQNYGSVLNSPIETIVLNTIETVIQADSMVKDVQVFLSLKGELISQITLRTPIARVEGSTKFYLDDSAGRMPLSAHHSARVPLITGKITDSALQDAHTILTRMGGDGFWKKHVIGIHIEGIENYVLKLRIHDFDLRLGSAKNLGQKLANFKAFYAKASKDKTLKTYKTVSLEFDNQVVCTKI